MDKDSYVLDLIQLINQNKEYNLALVAVSRKYHFNLNKGEISQIYLNLVQTKRIKSDQKLDSIFMARQVRSSSGILPISLSLDGREFSCRYNCHYCPNERKEFGAEHDIARSYLSSEGTFKNGLISSFCPIRQTIRRLLELESMGHVPDKLEFIILGGTFHSYDKEYRYDFIRKIYYACNIYPHFSIRFEGKFSDEIKNWLKFKPYMNKDPLPEDLILQISTEIPMKSLITEQEINETNICARLIGLVLETRPDQITLKSIKELREYGCTRVQLGIQHLDPFVLKIINRGHTGVHACKAIKLLRENGFKVDGHLMPDLPGSTYETDRKLFELVFQGEEFQLDYCKIYPCLDVPYTEIRKWKQRYYDTYDDEQTQKVISLMEKRNYQGLEYLAQSLDMPLKDILVWKPRSETDYKGFLNLIAYGISLVPEWTRINRVQRDFPESTTKNNNLGFLSENIQTNEQQKCMNVLKENGGICKDIRSREIRSESVDPSEAKILVKRYIANDGEEYFISIETTKYILGLIRLRLDHSDEVLDILKGCAKIRELHVYGLIQATHDEDHSVSNSQHKGFGKKLIAEAERIAKDNGYQKMAIISGVGVRGYYRNLGYTLQQTYMIKDL